MRFEKVEFTASSYVWTAGIDVLVGAEKGTHAVSSTRKITRGIDVKRLTFLCSDKLNPKQR